VQKVLGCFQERLAYSEKPMEDLAGEKEIMTWRKNADGVAKNKQQIIQKDWFKENGSID